MQWTERKYRPWPRPMRGRGRWGERPTGRGKLDKGQSSQEEGSRPPGPGLRNHQPFLFQAHVRKMNAGFPRPPLLGSPVRHHLPHLERLGSSPGKFKKNEN